MSKKLKFLWNVTKDSILQKENYYEIPFDRLFSENEPVEDWLSHLKNKYWFNEESENSFKQAVYEAKSLYFK